MFISFEMCWMKFLALQISLVRSLLPRRRVFPLITLFLTVLSFSQLGEGLKDRYDPVLR